MVLILLICFNFLLVYFVNNNNSSYTYLLTGLFGKSEVKVENKFVHHWHRRDMRRSYTGNCFIIKCSDSTTEGSMTQRNRETLQVFTVQ